MGKDLKLEIENRTKDLVESIREYSRSQKDLWQQVAAIAPEVKRKMEYFLFQSRVAHELRIDGYKDVYLKHNPFVNKYEDGYLKLTPGIGVDLQTGELVLVNWRYNSAPDGDVLELAAGLDNYLNADRALARLNADDRKLDLLLQKVEGVNSKR